MKAQTKSVGLGKWAVRGLFLTAMAAMSVATGCSAEAEEASQGDEDTSGEMGQSQDEVREVIPGPIAKSTAGEAWAVENQWADTATANAKKAGLAWGENSGLTWEQKYSKWVASFEKVDARNYGKTIRITTPWGKTLDGPVLECADVAIFLRATFAAWYHLPFYMTGWKNGATVYFGHFGVVDRNGNPVSGFPQFKAQYKDHEKTWRAGTAWPTDTNLRNKHVGTDDGASGVKIGETALKDGDGAGAYLDELHLNKRAAHLQIILDGYFGSANLADGANLFHIKPEATAPGDALVERCHDERRGGKEPVAMSEVMAGRVGSHGDDEVRSRTFEAGAKIVEERPLLPVGQGPARIERRLGDHDGLGGVARELRAKDRRDRVVRREVAAEGMHDQHAPGGLRRVREPRQRERDCRRGRGAAACAQRVAPRRLLRRRARRSGGRIHFHSRPGSGNRSGVRGPGVKRPRHRATFKPCLQAAPHATATASTAARRWRCRPRSRTALRRHAPRHVRARRACRAAACCRRRRSPR